MKKIFKNKKGVTLAELLAVVTIMGIIAAIAVPMVGNTIKNARKDAFLGDAIAIESALRTYCLTANEGDDACKHTAVASETIGVDLTDSNNVLATLISKKFPAGSANGDYSSAKAVVQTDGSIKVTLAQVGGFSFDDKPSSSDRSKVS